MTTKNNVTNTIDFDRLLKLRLAVARFGEMDNAQWWNTKGQLGRLGAMALRRGLPATHAFAQARIVFAVATHRCAEVFSPPNAVTLWQLPPEIEDQFDARLQQWLDDVDAWQPFFAQIQAIQGNDLVSALTGLGLVTDDDVEQGQRLKRSAEGRAVLIAGSAHLDDALVTQLALGFAKGEPGQPAIPYTRLGG